LRIVVAGAGAIGLLFGGILWLNGGDVILFTRRRGAAEAIFKEGILIESEDGVQQARPQCTTEPAQLGDAYLTILCVKSYDTEAVARMLYPHLPHHSLILTVQNGLGNVESLVQIFGKKRVIGGYTTYASTLVGINRVYQAYRGLTVIGRHPLTETRLADVSMVAEELTRHGIRTLHVDDIYPELLRKLAVNAVINPLTAILRVRNGEIAENPSIKPIVERVLEECVIAIKRLGAVMSLEELRQTVDEVARATARNMSSMLQDIERGRPTEIDHINGAVARVLREVGLEWSVNEVLTALVHGLESRGAGYRGDPR
jgi:2-dehydropantoate 2-reductase